MTWLCAAKLSVWSLVTVFLMWTGFVVGYVRGGYRATRRLKRRLQLAGSRFAHEDE